jgi:hypothetical protein
MTTDQDNEITAEIPQEYTDAFLQGYGKTMLWANTREYADPQDEGTPVDPDWWQDGTDPVWALSAFTPQSRQMIEADCADFTTSNWKLLKDIDPEQAGHDFALTRNRHGAGFWDRGLGEAGDKLTEAAHVYGESSAWMRDGEDVRLFDEPAILGKDGNVTEPEMEAG